MKKFLLTILLLLTPSITHAAGSNFMQTGLVAYWTMDGKDTTWSSATAGTIADKSGNGNTGTLTNMNQGASQAVGKIGQAFQMNTNGQVNQKVAFTGIASGNTFTFSTWIKPNTQSYAAGQIFDANGNGFYYVGSTKAISYYQGGDHFSGFTLTQNIWTHVVGVMNAGALTFYVNGAAGSSYSGLTGLTFIGFGTDASSEAFKGSMDEVRLYSRALSAAEVRQLYNYGQTQLESAQKNFLTTGLIGWWTMDGKDTIWTSPTACTEVDASGNGKTATCSSMIQSRDPAQGKIGQAFRFYANNVATAMSTANMGAQAQYSFSFWAKKMGTGPNEPRQIMVGQGDTYIDTCVSGQTFLSVNTSIGGQVTSGGGTCAPLNVWTFYTGTYNGTTQRLYVNGVSVASASNSGNIVNSVIFMGGYFGGGLNYNGLLDDVKVYSRALSATEVQQLYNYGKVVFKANLTKTRIKSP